jgi:hypothetical protein
MPADESSAGFRSRLAASLRGVRSLSPFSYDRWECIGQTTKEYDVTFFRRAREVTGNLAGAGKRQAQKGKLEVESRRLESRISSEKDAIGHALFPLLEAGTLTVELPEVDAHLETIGELLGELGTKRAEMEALAQPARTDDGDGSVVAEAEDIAAAAETSADPPDALPH